MNTRPNRQLVNGKLVERPPVEFGQVYRDKDHRLGCDRFVRVVASNATDARVAIEWCRDDGTSFTPPSRPHWIKRDRLRSRNFELVRSAHAEQTQHAPGAA